MKRQTLPDKINDWLHGFNNYRILRYESYETRSLDDYPYHEYGYVNHPQKGTNIYYGDIKEDKTGYLVELPYCTYSDYDNSCAVERANYKYLVEHYKELFNNGILYDCYGGYDTTAIICNVRRMFAVLKYYPDDNDLCYSVECFFNEIQALSNYPAFDDESVSDMEYELFEEALNSYVISDLIRAIDKYCYENELESPDIDNDHIRQFIYSWMSEHDINIQVESGGNVYLYPEIKEDDFIIAYLTTLESLSPIEQQITLKAIEK